MNPVDYISMNKEALWECDFCGKTEFNSDKLKKHVVKEHEAPTSGNQVNIKQVVL